MLSETTYKTIARTSAIYDLVVTSPFMTPWTLLITLDVIHGLHTTLGLPGAVPTFGAIHLLFGGLLGSVVVVWSLARLHLNLAILGRYDALARFLFAAWQIFAVANGATPVVLIFTVFEIAFGVAQLLPYRTASRNELFVSAPLSVA